MAKLTKMQKEIIEQKFTSLFNEARTDLEIIRSDVEKLFPTFIKFCRQDPNIILNILEDYEKIDNNWILYKTFLIKNSSVGYPFVKLESMCNNFLDNIEKCGQRFIEGLIFAKSFSIDNIQKTFDDWKQDHVIPKIKILKSIQEYLLIEFTSESAPTMLKNFNERINNIDVNIVSLTINKGE